MVFRQTDNVVKDKKGRIKSMWTKTKVQLVHDLYVTKKYSMSSTARQLHCATSSVQQLLERKNWNRKIRNHKKHTLDYCDLHRRAILVRYKKESAQQISDALNLSLRGVIQWLKTQGVWRDEKARVSVAIKAGRHRVAVMLDACLKNAFTLNVDTLHYLEYAKLARVVTNKVYLQNVKRLDPKKKRSYEWHLDHIFSIKNATHRKVDGAWVLREKKAPLSLLCHPGNLRIVSRAENSRKHNRSDPSNSSISLLKKRVADFNDRFGNPFEKYEILQ